MTPDLLDTLARHGAEGAPSARPSWWRLRLHVGRHRPEVVEARLADERARSEADTQQLPRVVDEPEPAYAEAGSS